MAFIPLEAFHQLLIKNKPIFNLFLPKIANLALCNHQELSLKYRIWGEGVRKSDKSACINQMQMWYLCLLNRITKAIFAAEAVLLNTSSFPFLWGNWGSTDVSHFLTLRNLLCIGSPCGDVWFSLSTLFFPEVRRELWGLSHKPLYHAPF